MDERAGGPLVNSSENPARVMVRQQIDHLIDLLWQRGYCVVGPTLRDGVIVYDELAGTGDLPVGWTDQHRPGQYRVSRRDDDALFGYNVGPHSWKQFLHPARHRLWQARRGKNGIEVAPDTAAVPKYAFIGVRACELAAIAIQDRVFQDPQFPDTNYMARRENALFIAVNCTEAGETCFCASMETGPQAQGGYDIALTEIRDGGGHRFLVETGSDRGAGLIGEISAAEADQEDRTAAREAVAQAATQMGRALDTTGIRELLQENPDHPRWDDVAARCLTCANCTMVCPTCFCTSVEDVTALDGDHAERWQHWDSCFTMDFSYIHGGAVRQSAKSRYRQWMTHKFANWIDQFGSSGCVGCGRCITWCPVGIDITEELAAIRAGDGEKENVT